MLFQLLISCDNSRHPSANKYESNVKTQIYIYYLFLHYTKGGCKTRAHKKTKLEIPKKPDYYLFLLLASPIQIRERNLFNSWQRSSAPCTLALISINLCPHCSTSCSSWRTRDRSLMFSYCTFYSWNRENLTAFCLLTTISSRRWLAVNTPFIFFFFWRDKLRSQFMIFKSFNPRCWSTDFIANWYHFSLRFLFVSLLWASSRSSYEMISRTTQSQS